MSQLDQKYLLNVPKLEWFFLRNFCCSETIFTSMTQEELIFAMGHPDKVNTTVIRGAAKREQWVYLASYYYFQN